MSMEDFKSIINLDSKEFRIITTKNIFRLKRPVSGWPFVIESDIFIDHYNESFYKVERLLNQKYDEGNITGDYLKMYLNHFVWIDFFAKFDIEYKVY